MNGFIIEAVPLQRFGHALLLDEHLPPNLAEHVMNIIPFNFMYSEFSHDLPLSSLRHASFALLFDLSALGIGCLLQLALDCLCFFQFLTWPFRNRGRIFIRRACSQPNYAEYQDQYRLHASLPG